MSTPTAPPLDPGAYVLDLLRRARLQATVITWDGPGGVIALAIGHRPAAMAVLAVAGCATSVHPQGLSVTVPDHHLPATDAELVQVLAAELAAPRDLHESHEEWARRLLARPTLRIELGRP